MENFEAVFHCPRGQVIHYDFRPKESPYICLLRMLANPPSGDRRATPRFRLTIGVSLAHHGWGGGSRLRRGTKPEKKECPARK